MIAIIAEKPEKQKTSAPSVISSPFFDFYSKMAKHHIF
jgi:hypothetical protein